LAAKLDKKKDIPDLLDKEFCFSRDESGGKGIVTIQPNSFGVATLKIIGKLLGKL